jgi:hypothetical protein
MLYVNNIVNQQNCNFKRKDRCHVIKLGKKIMHADEYVKSVDRAILINAMQKNNLFECFRTANFARFQYEKFRVNAEENLYNKILDKCFKDIEKAIKTKQPQEKIDKLMEIPEIFIKKFGYFGK